MIRSAVPVPTAAAGSPSTSPSRPRPHSRTHTTAAPPWGAVVDAITADVEPSGVIGSHLVAAAARAEARRPLARSAYRQPFAETSPWNMSLSTAATYAAANDAATARLATGPCHINSDNGYGIAINVAQARDPLGTVTGTGGQTHRIPTDARIVTGSDRNMNIVTGRHCFEYWDVTKTGDNAYSTSYGQVADLLGSGINTGIRASLFSTMGGLIRLHEVDELSIPHALVLAAPATHLKHGWQWPAYAEHGSLTYTGDIPMGTLFAIPPSVDLANLGLSREGRALATALQDFGAYMGDHAAQVVLFAEDLVERQAQPAWSRMNLDWQNIVRPLLRRVTNASSSAVGGPGDERRRAAPGPPRIELTTDIVQVRREVDRRGDTDWRTPTAFTNNWTGAAVDGYAPARYMKDIAGFVRLSGHLRGGTTFAAGFTLPLGYRPQYKVPFSNGEIQPNGEVYLTGSGPINLWSCPAFRPVQA